MTATDDGVREVPEPNTRIVVWNCRAGLSPLKLARLEALGADVMVVPELQPRFVVPEGWTAVLRSDSASRVLAVLARPGWSLTAVRHDPKLPWLLPLEVKGPNGQQVTLLAVWTVESPGSLSYTKQAQRALEDWEHSCREAGEEPWTALALAGDFNASMQTAKVTGHLRTLAMLEDRGLVSSYHRTSGCEHGEEPAGTLRWVAPGGVPLSFHCDFVFVSADLADRTHTAIGTFQDWCGPRLSDHVPVIANLALPAVGLKVPREPWRAGEALGWIDRHDPSARPVADVLLERWSGNGWTVAGGRARQPSLNVACEARDVGRKYPFVTQSLSGRGAVLELRLSDFANTPDLALALARAAARVVPELVDVSAASAAGFRVRPRIRLVDLGAQRALDLVRAVEVALSRSCWRFDESRLGEVEQSSAWRACAATGQSPWNEPGWLDDIVRNRLQLMGETWPTEQECTRRVMDNQGGGLPVDVGRAVVAASRPDIRRPQEQGAPVAVSEADQADDDQRMSAPDVGPELAHLLGVDTVAELIGGIWRATGPEWDGPETHRWFVAGSPAQVALGVQRDTGHRHGPRVLVCDIEFSWEGPGALVYRPGTIRFDGRVPDDGDRRTRLQKPLSAACKARRVTFRWCRYCRELTPPEFQFDHEVCSACASKHLGVVF